MEKNLAPNADNALFDCPVVSRLHAELRAHPWSHDRDQVTIIDNGSMHGTRVNGQALSRGRCMALRDGDRITLGERVTRGDGKDKQPYCAHFMDQHTNRTATVTHEAVELEYRRASKPNSQSSAIAQSIPRGFHVPDRSDGELSDDEISIISDDDDAPLKSSSANTTPEQPKGRLGSQENPIPLEPLNPSVVDVTGDNIVIPSSRYESPSPPPVPQRLGQSGGLSNPLVVDSTKVIQDSVDQGNSLYDSCRPPVQRLDLATIVDDDEASTNSDAESLMAAEEFEDGEDALGDEDALGESDALGDEDEDALQDERDAFDNDSICEPESFTRNKGPSPELGSDTGYIPLSPSVPSTPANKPTVDDEWHYSISPATNPSSSASQPNRSSFLPPPPPALGPRYHPHFSNGPWNTVPAFHTFSGPSTNHSFARHEVDPSGWDSRPTWEPFAPPRGPPFASALASYPPLPPPPPPRPTNAFGARGNFNMPPPPPPPLAQAPSFEENFQNVYDQMTEHARNAIEKPPVPPTAMSRGKPRWGWEAPEQQKESPKKRLAINELVEPGMPKESPAAGTKRKANDISDDEESLLSEQDLETSRDNIDLEEDEEEILRSMHDAVATEATATVNQVEAEKASEEPSPKHRKVTAEQDVSTAPAAEPTIVVERAVAAEAAGARSAGSGVKDMARMAGGAVLGSAATIAFLCSPLAERALEWLA